MSGPRFAGPPLNCPPDWLRDFILARKEGDRVIEMGECCMKGETGTVEMSGGHVCIRWDTKFSEGAGMVSGFTGGARLLLEDDKEQHEQQS